MREVLEETGLTIDPTQLNDQSMVTFRVGTRLVFYYLYLLDVINSDDDAAFAVLRSKSSHEVRDIRWFPLDGIPEPPQRQHDMRVPFSQITTLLRLRCQDCIVRRNIHMKFASAAPSSATASAAASASAALSSRGNPNPSRISCGHLVGVGSTEADTIAATTTTTTAIAVHCPECGKW